MTYRYRAYTQDKKLVSGTIDAVTEALAEKALYESGYQYILEIKSVATRPTKETILPSLFGIRSRDVIDFSRQLATFTESGVSLSIALQLLEEQTTNTAFKKIITELIKELNNGNSFSKSISKYPNVFPYSYVQIISASEETGELDSGLKQVADYMERQSKVKSSVISALTYPMVVIIMAIGVFILLVTVVMPPIFQLYSVTGATLPRVTMITMAIVGFLKSYGLHILLAILLFIITVFVTHRTKAGRFYFDGIILRLPVIGKIIAHRALAKFCRTTYMLLHAGLQLPKVLDITIRTVSTNQVITGALTELKQKLIQGEGLSKSMQENTFFPDTVNKLITVGEVTGDIESALNTLATYYEERTNQRILWLISILQPTLTAIIGIVVAFLLLSIMLPLYSILRSVH